MFLAASGAGNLECKSDYRIFVGEFSLSLSIVMSMTLGIVIDDTVHLFD